MNKASLKSYAPEARRDFISMVKNRAAQLGLSEQNGKLVVEDMLVQGDVAIIAGQVFPAAIDALRKRLIIRFNTQGFDPTLEAIAYTWFNRFAALRYMELHDYLEHGQRVLSSITEGGLPDILTHALELAESNELPNISTELVSELKLANKDGELYKRLLVAQCNKLATVMPFLFEKIDDETELLLPDNLLRTDSVIRKLVETIEEADWNQVEIIGWLYQFYISEKKDQVMGKVVKGEDIPAATQLFTPNWIVKYLVQNSVGRLWLQANSSSTLASQWEYYIQPAEQTPDVNTHLATIIQTRIAEDGAALNPETITVLDPACGSGHILVEAYDLLKAIYLERAYQPRIIPRLILEKNLFGLDIDDRAAQLAGFALLMKARADDRRLFENTPMLNVMALQDSSKLDIPRIAETILSAAIHAEGKDAIHIGQLFGGHELPTQHSSGINATDLVGLLSFFRNSKIFGSLLSLPLDLTEKLSKIEQLLKVVVKIGDDLSKSYALQIYEQFLMPAKILCRSYDAVIANPPYMGGKGMNAELKEFSKKGFPDSKSDLFAMFIERSLIWCKPSGFSGLVTMQSWMFLTSFKILREKLLTSIFINNFVHIGYNSFPELNSKIAQACMFSFFKTNVREGVSRFVDLNSCVPSSDKNREFLLNGTKSIYDQKQAAFSKMPGSPIAFKISLQEKEAFSANACNGDLCETSNGVQTGDNSLFVREWYEVSQSSLGSKWVPYNKGGPYKKWFGNAGSLINWENNGAEIKARDNSCFRGEHLYFNPCLTWTDVTWRLSGRILESGFISDAAGPCAYFKNESDMYFALGLMNTPLADEWSKLINPTLHFQAGDFKKLPLPKAYKTEHVLNLVKSAISITKCDFNEQELSKGFMRNPLCQTSCNLPESFKLNMDTWHQRIEKMQEIENSNLDFLMSQLNIFDREKPLIKPEWITLECNPKYLFGDTSKADVQFIQKIAVDLVSYVIGCVMGRYSLDEEGLVYAHFGNEGFDHSHYISFPADADGIVPTSDVSWFSDDATSRIREFLLAVWGRESLSENINWLADSLGRKNDETVDETIRRYISGSFFSDHCQTYKRRPIYWLFSSGKQKAFECLVYLHRYNEGTLARMRAEYVVPLTGKMADRIKRLEDDAPKASSTAERKKIDNEIKKLKLKLEELRQYDEKLRHYADMRIALDLDDGVKVNYGKFGDLLDGVKAITGGSSED